MKALTSRLQIRIAMMALVAVAPALSVVLYGQALMGRALLLTAIALAAILLALCAGEWLIARPIKSLKAVTSRLAAGDLSARAQLAGFPGLSEIGDAVNDMAAALDRRQQEREQAERRLRASEDQYRLLFHESPEAMWITEAGTSRFLAVNQAALERYGYPRDEFLALTLKALHPDEDHLALDEPSRDAMQYCGVWRHRTSNGVILDVDIRSNVVRWNGSAARLSVVGDITHRKQLEDQLRQSQKMDAIGQLAGGIAHDFNNVLTAIQGYAELLWEMLAGDERQVEAGEITRAAGRAAALTRQLLAFSRKQILAPRAVRLGDVVAEITPMLRRLIGENIDLQTVTADHGFIRADDGQLEQVLMNLAVNARDAMRDGGRLTIETENVDLDEAYARQHPGVEPGEYILLAITDTGHGMDLATSARVFEPFFTTKPKGKGTGLGLATVSSIVKQSGGYVTLSSEVGRGTTFEVYLPVTGGVARAATAPRVIETNERGCGTVLLVEDEEGVRRFVEKVLTRQGYTVHVAPTPTLAIEFVRHGLASIDLLLTDVLLPDMNGRELADRLHRDRPGCRVLFMSGYTDHAIVHQGILDPGTWFIQKPFTSKQLVQKVHDVLSAASDVAVA